MPPQRNEKGARALLAREYVLTRLVSPDRREVAPSTREVIRGLLIPSRNVVWFPRAGVCLRCPEPEADEGPAVLNH